MDFETEVNEGRHVARAEKEKRIYEVVCVVGGSGFPFGALDAPRIINVGKALQKAGMGFRVLHCGPSPIAANKNVAGVHEEIAYEVHHVYDETTRQHTAQESTLCMGRLDSYRSADCAALSTAPDERIYLYS